MLSSGAITNRILKQCGHVVTYITHAWDGVAPYVRKAKDQKKNGAQPAIAYPQNEHLWLNFGFCLSYDKFVRQENFIQLSLPERIRCISKARF